MNENTPTSLEQFEYDGLWFLLNEQTDPIRGKIKYIDNNIILTLYFSTLDMKNKKHHKLLHTTQTIPLLLGITNNGDKITLNDLNLVSSNTSHRNYDPDQQSDQNTLISKSPSHITHFNYVESTYSIKTLYVGAHLTSQNNNMIIYNSKLYDELNQWVDNSQIKTDHDIEKNEYTITTKVISEVGDKINNKFNYKLRQIVYNPGHSVYATEVCVKQHTYLILSSTIEQPQNEFEIIHTRLKNLLALFIGQNIKSLHTKIMQNNQFEPIYVYKNFINVTLKRDPPTIRNMFIPLRDISTHLPNIFQNWICAYETYAMSFDAFFENAINTMLYPQDAFENLIEALESYHDKSLDEFNKIIDQNNINNFEKIKSMIYDELNIDEQQWLDDIINHNVSHNTSLFEKICHLFLLFPYMCSYENMVEISKRIRDIRNTLIHNHETDIDQSEILYINKMLELLMTACVLSELHFDESTLKKFVLKSAKIKSIYGVIGATRPFESFWTDIQTIT